jgi:hypothetical protein
VLSNLTVFSEEWKMTQTGTMAGHGNAFKTFSIITNLSWNRTPYNKKKNAPDMYPWESA